MRARKIFLRVVVVVTALVLCAGATIYFLLRPRSYEWREITSTDNQFRVSLPAAPSLLETSEKSMDGRPFVSHVLKSTPVDRVYYVVSWWENPAQKDLTPEELFARFPLCGISLFHGRVIGERDLTVQGHPAKFIMIMGGSLTVEDLAIRAGNRVYSLTVSDPRNVALEGENIKKFFHSFRLEQ